MGPRFILQHSKQDQKQKISHVLGDYVEDIKQSIWLVSQLFKSALRLHV